jgi:hypothetical protein
LARVLDKGVSFTRWYVDGKPAPDLEGALAVINGQKTLEQVMAEAERKAVQRFSLTAQIAEVDRELALRAKVYPHQVSSGAMRQSIADHHVELMKSVKRTLEWLRDNELVIKQRCGEAA